MIEKGETVVVDGIIREAEEVFRASGTLWVRYLHPNGSNGYATEMEWLLWIYKNTKTRK